MINPEEIALWRSICSLQGRSFVTSRGLVFEYTIKGAEIFIDRKQKSITRASVMLAYQQVKVMNGMVAGPKKLKIFGASYIFPIFLHLGVIKRPNETK